MGSLKTRILGRSGIEVSAIGMGCWAIGGPFWRGETPVGWGEVDDNESISAVHRALDLGITFFDTSNVYGAGHSERVLARALVGHWDKVVIATKFGNLFDEETKQAEGTDATPEGIRAQCEGSLKRMNTDVIDLYQFHLGDFKLENAAEVRDTLEALVTEGKIRAYAWSTDSVERVERFAEGEHCTAVQNNLNVLQDSPQIIAACERLNLASVNRGPLAMGMLTGKYKPESTLADNDVRGKNAPSWMTLFVDGKPNPEYMRRMDAIREILTSEGRTLAQGALAWIWARSEKTVPIPGFRTVAQVEDNCGAMDKGALTVDQMREIEVLLDRQPA